MTAPLPDVFRAAAQQAGEMRWGVLYSDVNAGVLRLETPKSLSAWSDTVAVNLTPSDSGVVVLVRSSLGQEPNRRNVGRYLNAVRLRLGLPADTTLPR